MSKEIIVAFIARDRPGVVEQVSEIVTSHNGNWQESRMAHLAETFTGILGVTVSEENAQALTDALMALEEDGFRIMLQDAGASSMPTNPILSFEIKGPDHPGIVHQLTRTIAGLGASVEEMETRLDSAPVSGEPLFVADTRVRLPDGLSEGAFRDALESSADALFVDLVLTNV